LTASEIISRKQQTLLVRLWNNPNNEAEEDIYQQLNRQEGMVQVELEEDIYCHGFRIFLQSQSASLQN
jgi:hypothetical protein